MGGCGRRDIHLLGLEDLGEGAVAEGEGELVGLLGKLLEDDVEEFVGELLDRSGMLCSAAKNL